MEQEKQEEAISFIPVIPRLDRLDRLLQVLEEKHRYSRRDFTACTGERDECKTMSSALEEVQHKGTLLDRLALLENRVLQLQLSLEMDEENTSKSSSSTFQIFHERTGKDAVSSSTIVPRKDVNEAKLTPQEMQNDTFNQAEEASSSEGDFVTKRTEQHRSKGPNRKSKQKWLGLFRFRFTC